MNEIVKYNNDFNLLPMPELKAIQMDMFMCIISLVREKKENTPFLKHFFDPDKRKIVIPQKKFIEICRLNDSNLPYPKIYYGLDDCLKKLCSFVISYQKDEKTLYNFVCFEEADIIVDEVHIVLQSRFYDMIVNKKYGFTRFELVEFIALSGKYTKTLYRLLKQFRSTGFAKFQWDEFLRIMKIPEKLKMCDIDKDILKPAIKELTKENNLFDPHRMPFKNLEYTKEKAGRGSKVIGITFTFKPETKNSDKEKIQELEKENKALEQKLQISKTTEQQTNQKHLALIQQLNIGQEFGNFIGLSFYNEQGEIIKIKDVWRDFGSILKVRFENKENEKTFVKDFESEKHLEKYLNKFVKV